MGAILKRLCLALALLMNSCSLIAGAIDAATECAEFHNSSGRRVVDVVLLALDESRFLILAHATDFEWDELHVFPPYADSNLIRRKVGEDIPCSRVDVTEVSLLVFMRDGKVVEALDWSIRRDADFSYLGRVTYSAAEARFILDEAPLSWSPGKTWYLLHDSPGRDPRILDIRDTLIEAARRIFDLNDRSYDLGTRPTAQEARKLVSKLEIRHLALTLLNFRAHKHNVGFCLLASDDRVSGAWHLSSVNSLAAPKQGPCPSR